MGNWRTINITGTMNEKDAKKVEKYLQKDFSDDDWNCFHTSGLMGVPHFGMISFNFTGNLAERDFEVEDVRKEIEKIAGFAPSINCKIHCGGDYESKECVATIICKDGQATISKPEVQEIGEIPQSQVEAQLYRALFRKN